MPAFSLPESLSAIRNRDIAEDDLDQYGAEWIQQFTPILWFHPDEHFFPEDCANLLTRSVLIRDGQPDYDVDSLDQLGEEDESTFFKIPDVDMDRFIVPGNHPTIPGVGPEAMAKVACHQYANNPFLDGDREAELVYYAQLSNEKVAFRTSYDPDFPEHQVLAQYNGKYLIIRYFFFYIFNDSWNKHVGDWDSSIQVAIPYDVDPDDQKALHRPLVIYPQHHTRWIAEGMDVPNLTQWLLYWTRGHFRQHVDDGEYVTNFGPAFFHGTHPYGFVACGGHGVYPTPGYSLYYADFPGDCELPIMADERVIGRTCIHTKDLDRTEIEADLRAGRLKTRAFQSRTWDRYVVLNDLERDPNARWYRFKGFWGQISDWKGWGGPATPWLNREKLEDILFWEERALKSKPSIKRYTDGGQVFTRTKNLHVFGYNDLA